MAVKIAIAAGPGFPQEKALAILRNESGHYQAQEQFFR